MYVQAAGKSSFRPQMARPGEGVLMPLLFILVIWPLIEIALFVQIGGAIGLWPTLAVVIGTAVLGVWLMRRRGAVALADVQRAVAEFRDPSAPMAKGAFLMLSGGLLVLPGFLTDALGLLLLLIPPVRGLILRMAGRRMGARVVRTGFMPNPAPHRYNRGAVIDGDYVDQTEDIHPARPVDAGSRPPSGWTRGPEAH